MDNKMEVATMDDLKTKITDRVKSSFVELIPEEAWRAMVGKEIERFTTEYREHNTDKPSSLQALIREELTSRLKTQIKEELGKANYQKFEGMAPEFIKEVIKEAAPALIESLFNRAVQDAVVSVHNSLRQGY